jgi:hypothetical protein
MCKAKGSAINLRKHQERERKISKEQLEKPKLERQTKPPS